MTLFEKIANRILRFLGLTKLNENPNDDRFTYIGNPENVQKRKIQECKWWYYGDSDELLNFYTAMATYGNAEEPIYNRNKSKYFWGINPKEDIKRVHSGIPHVMVDTLVNIIGTATYTCDGYQEVLDKIIKDNKLNIKINQQQMPMTLALGYGAFKPVINPDLSSVPLIEWYDAEDVNFIRKNGVLIGIVYKDYYTYQNRDYVLLETRRTAKGDSYIEWELFRLEKNNEVKKVPLNTIPQLADLNPEGLKITGLNIPLGVDSVYFWDMLNKDYGRSIYSGKIDLFDDLDQILSQDSQTVRVSTPVEYYPRDLLERNGKTGQPLMPKVYNRQYVAYDSYPNGDGQSNDKIYTTQPMLNFTQYSADAMDKLTYILSGVLSPSSFGLNVSLKDNAEAQREKEKTTIMTRDNIISSQEDIMRRLLSMCLMMEEYMRTGNITIRDYEISVKFSSFANPSFESLSQTLTPMFNSGAISTEMYVEKLYGDSLSKKEKEKEILRLNEQKQKESLNMGDFNNETTITSELE